MSTRRLCHITSTPSGTSPSIFRLIRFRRYPSGPVISALGIRSALDMCAPLVGVIDIKTPPAPKM